MRPILVKCTHLETKDTVNGPLTRVTLAPDGPLNTTTGELTVFVHDDDGYKVGRRFVLIPRPA
jgi:hypothetical protein